MPYARHTIFDDVRADHERGKPLSRTGTQTGAARHILNTTVLLWVGVVLARGAVWVPLAVGGVLVAQTLPQVVLRPLAGICICLGGVYAALQLDKPAIPPDPADVRRYAS